jgi:hypothetical protein
MDKPEWATYLEKVGQLAAQLGLVEYGQPVPRIILSVPTGRFSYWLLASGALQATVSTPRDVPLGTRVATWAPSPANKMQDIVLESSRPGEWQLTPTTKVVAGSWPLMPIPGTTPEDRGGGRPSRDYKEQLRVLPGRDKDWYKWYATQCLSPVVIVGSGREHIQRQRATLLEHARHWFPQEVAALLDEDGAMTSNPERMLFHPFMVFDAGVGERGAWLRQMSPRLVVVTSWSSRARLRPMTFSRAPHVIITNRRVRSAVDAVEELGQASRMPDLEKLLAAGRPAGVFSAAFSVPAQGEASATDPDFDDEDVI